MLVVREECKERKQVALMDGQKLKQFEIFQTDTFDGINGFDRIDKFEKSHEPERSYKYYRHEGIDQDERGGRDHVVELILKCT